MAVRLAVSGVLGRMGRRVASLAADNDMIVKQALEREGHPQLGENLSKILPELNIDCLLLSELFTDVDVCIDFSSPNGIKHLLETATSLGIPLISGTTGLSVSDEAEIQKAAKIIPILHATNFSLGVQLMIDVVSGVAKALGPAYDIEIVESHHHHKADAPSGTALSLARSVCNSRDLPYPGSLRYGRQGTPGARNNKEIGMHSLRLGAVVGEHEVFFANETECLSIRHRAENRDVFASGAIRAAHWIIGREPGLYSLRDVLFN